MSAFTTKRLFRLPGFFLQIQPKEERRFAGKSLFLARSRVVWIVSMPKALGGTSGYSRMCRRLSRFSLAGPRWAPEAITKEAETVRYDFAEHRRRRELYWAIATRTWGWNRRDWSSDHQTEFFNFYRMITFQWALSVLRDHIVDQLNRLFRRLDLSASLTLHGFLGPSEVLAVRERMCRGSVSLSDAYTAVGFVGQT